MGFIENGLYSETAMRKTDDDVDWIFFKRCITKKKHLCEHDRMVKGKKEGKRESRRGGKDDRVSVSTASLAHLLSPCVCIFRLIHNNSRL